MAPSDTQLTTAVRQAFEQARKDALIFAVLTVALTPFVLGLAGLVCFIGLLYIAGDVDLASTTGMWIFVTVFLLLGLWNVWRSSAQPPWLAVAMIAGIAALTAVGPTGILSWQLHLALCGSLTFGALALMGRAYEPRDNLYLGTAYGNDPLTITDDVDRAHVMTGCAMALPALVLGAFSEIFASTWLFHGVTEDLVDGGVKVLTATHAGKTDEAIRSIGYERRRVLDLLRRAELVRTFRGKATLTEKGHALFSAR